MTNLRRSSIIAIGVGSVFLGSWLWPSVVGNRRAWSDEQAKELTQAAVDFHRLSHETEQAKNDAAKETANASSGKNANVTDPNSKVVSPAPIETALAKADRLAEELSVAESRLNRNRAALKDAQTAGQTAAVILRWLGLAAVFAGLVGLIIGQQKIMQK